MITEVTAGRWTVRGISVGGVYTSLQLPEWGVVLDAGVPIRSFAATDRFFLSHGHADHASALVAYLGIRRLIGKGPPTVYLPAEILPHLLEAVPALERLHRCDLSFHAVPVSPGDEFALGSNRFVRAFRTQHSVPSLGYVFLERVTKLREEFRALPGPEIARLRQEGRPEVFDSVDRLEIAYATDTLSDVLEAAPEIATSRVLIMESTFVDEHRTVALTRERGHTHLDELIARADRLKNEAIVLMHFSQAYSPSEVHRLVRERLPESLRDRVHVFAPESGRWFG